MEDLKKNVLKINAKGFNCRKISEHTGVNQSILSRIVNGYKVNVNLYKNKIKAMLFSIESGELKPPIKSRLKRRHKKTEVIKLLDKVVIHIGEHMFWLDEDFLVHKGRNGEKDRRYDPLASIARNLNFCQKLVAESSKE